GQRYFDGFRDLATNGIDKPVLNVFRMLGRLSGSRVAVDVPGALPLDEVRDRDVRERADVNALASRDARSLAVLVWHYHDDDVAAPPAKVSLTIDGLPAGRATVHHYRVDGDHSNAYEAWKRMGSPQPPSAVQLQALEKAGLLQELGPARAVRLAGGSFTTAFSLPRQGVSLVTLTF